MRSLLIGLVVCLVVDLTIGMTLFRAERQMGGGRGRGRAKGHRGHGPGKGHRGSHEFTEEQLKAKIQRHLEEFNTECDGVTTASCDPIDTEVSNVLSQMYAGNTDEDALITEFISMIEKIEVTDERELHCTIRNCLVAKMYADYKAGTLNLPGCDVEEAEVELEEDSGDENGGEMCEAQQVLETCDLTETDGVFTVDADACSTALAQKIYAANNAATAAEKRKRLLVKQLKRLLKTKAADSDTVSEDDSEDGDISSGDKRSLDSDSDSAHDDSDKKRKVLKRILSAFLA